MTPNLLISPFLDLDFVQEPARLGRRDKFRGHVGIDPPGGEHLQGHSRRNLDAGVPYERRGGSDERLLRLIAGVPGTGLFLPQKYDMRRWLARLGKFLISAQLIGDHLRVEGRLQHRLAGFQQLNQVSRRLGCCAASIGSQQQVCQRWRQ